MVLAGAFGFFLLLLLIIGDWYQFTSISAFSTRYGCGVARREEQVQDTSPSTLTARFDQRGVLQLPHGIARFFQDQQVIVIRPYYQLFAMRFRTAWPLKGTIEVAPSGSTLHLKLVKRMPWSSALITLTWLGVVVLGTLAFVIAFAINDGFHSAGGVLMGVGVVGLGLLVLAFGLIMVSLAFRLEDQRLMQVYEEFRGRLLPATSTSPSAH